MFLGAFESLWSLCWYLIHFFVYGFASLVYLPQTLNIYFFHRSKLENYRLPSSYALITGATDGIGLALAIELAKQGWNVILHGRSPSKLGSAAETLRKSYPSQKFPTLLADATDRTLDINKFLEPVQSLRITLLVNNVGGSADSYLFQETSTSAIEDTTHGNCIFAAKLTSRLIATSILKPREACIINISSLCSVLPDSYNAVYGAAKAYMNMLGSSLRAAGLGIEIITVSLGGVQTNIVRPEEPSWLVPSASEFAKCVLRMVGLGWDHDVVWPWLPHAIVWGWLCGACLPKEACGKVWMAYYSSVHEVWGRGGKVT